MFSLSTGKTKSKDDVFIIAEISANHDRNFKKAVSLIKKAKAAGADAVKFQTYTPDTLTINVDNKYFRIKGPYWGGQTLYDLYKKAFTPWRWFRGLKEAADEVGIIFSSTASDKTSVDFLEEIGVPFHKVASFDLVDLELIEYIAKTKKPVIMSTGISTLAETEEAVKVAKKAGASNIILLECVSRYPAKPEEMNLSAIPAMEKLFNLPIGLSDHTLGTGVSIAAASMGAKVIEKHFTLSRKVKTPDSFFSMEPHEFKDMVKNIRIAEQALKGNRCNLKKAKGKAGGSLYRRSIFVIKDTKKGEILTRENIRSIRPGYGLHPRYLDDVLGKQVVRYVKRGTPLSWDLVRHSRGKS